MTMSISVNIIISPIDNGCDRTVINAVTTDLDWDAKPSTFQYNRVGSMTRTTETFGIGRSRITDIQAYDERQLPEHVRIRNIENLQITQTYVRYRYDVEDPVCGANGQRIRKQIRDTESGPDVLYERYVRDGMRLVGVFDENDNLQSWNIGGAAGLVGRADPATLGYARRFYVTDHLGSIRAVLNASGTVTEGRDYYPYGLTIPGRFYVQADTTREGYTGHELDRETGDYYAGARYYGPALGRWFVPDPMAEAYPGLSPYNYVMGNPLSLIDPDGMEADDDVDQVSAPRTTENFYPEDLFVYGMRNHPGARTPIVRVWVDGPSDQGTAATGDNTTIQSIGSQERGFHGSANKSSSTYDCCVFTIELQGRVHGVAYTTPGAIGIAIDTQGNIVTYASGGGGIGFGLQVQLTAEVAIFPSMSYVSELEGLGFTLGAAGGVGKYQAVELSSSGADLKVSYGFGVGVGLGVFAEMSRTILGTPVNVPDLMRSVFRQNHKAGDKH